MKFKAGLAAAALLALAACGGGQRAAVAPQAPMASSASILTFPGGKLSYAITRSAAGVSVTDKASGVQTAVPSGTSQLVFADSAVLFDASGTEGQAYRLYQAAFDRKPDMGGLGYQIDAVQKIGLTNVAGNFLASPEFQSRYSNLSNEQFVTQLYQNVLHRAPDAGGLAFHVNNLAAGLPRNYLLVQFSESPENQANVLGTIQAGVTFVPLGASGLTQDDEPIRLARGLQIQAYNADGSAASIGDFVNFTHYQLNRWSSFGNYGVFAMGKLPASSQIASDISVANIDGVDTIVADAPMNQAFYFTALWKAPTIGAVFMRADAEGAGYVVSGTTAQKIELPYDFAISEFKQAQTQAAAMGSLSTQAQSLLTNATSAIAQARTATTASARARAAYTALSYVMPLKERLVLDASASWLAAHGARNDFDLNYEGFGSWTDDTALPGYNSAKDAGFTSVYTAIDWNQVSPTRGTYNLDGLDYQIDRALALGFKVGLNINGHFGGLPPWAQALPFDDLKALYYENARRVVARYGSKVSFYYPAGELELDMGSLTMAQAAELARQSLAGARAAAPNTPFGYYASASAYVSYQMNRPATTSVRSGTDLIAYMKANGINHDFIGLEMQYGTTFAPIDLQRFAEVLQKTYDIAQVPIYMGETGYSSMAEDYGIAGSYFWHDGLTRQAQYEWADGTLRALYAMPFVKGYYWVHLDPDNNDRGSDYLSGLVGSGFVSASGAIKKVQSAFKDFMTHLPATVQ